MEDVKLKTKKRRLISSRTVRIFFWSYHTIVILTIIGSVISMLIDKGRIETGTNHIILCIFVLIIYDVPLLLRNKIRIQIPTFLQIFALSFVFAHFIAGEIFRAYDHVPLYDKTLHALSGLALSTLGFSLINLLNKSENAHIKLSPGFVVLFAFCFSLAVGAIWEIVEFIMDSVNGGNMQRWQDSASTLTERGSGLTDTMWDLIVCLIGSAAVCIAGYISLKTKGNFLNSFLIKRATIVESDKIFIKEIEDDKAPESDIVLEEEPEKQTGQDFIQEIKSMEVKKPVIVIEPDDIKETDFKPVNNLNIYETKEEIKEPTEEERRQTAAMLKVREILKEENEPSKTSKKKPAEVNEYETPSPQYLILKELLEKDKNKTEEKTDLPAAKTDKKPIEEKPSNFQFMQLKDLIKDDDK